MRWNSRWLYKEIAEQRTANCWNPRWSYTRWFSTDWLNSQRTRARSLWNYLWLRSQRREEKQAQEEEGRKRRKAGRREGATQLTSSQWLNSLWSRNGPWLNSQWTRTGSKRKLVLAVLTVVGLAAVATQAVLGPGRAGTHAELVELRRRLHAQWRRRRSTMTTRRRNAGMEDAGKRVAA